MAQVTVSIQRSKVYAVAEGISVTISRHSGGTPSYEQLWASPSESPKLDIYYREAVGDLERRLIDWATATSSQFDLSADGTDYTLTLGMSRHWPTRLKGLLDNKIQDYLVHAVTAGWLNDFDGLTVKQDYQAMSAQDLLDILAIVYQRVFDFDESQRTADDSQKEGPDTISTEQRTADDAGKGSSSFPTHALSRRRDDVVKRSNDDLPPLCRPHMMRHRDNAFVDTHSDWTDWGGTGMPFRDRMIPCPHPHPHCLPHPHRVTRPMTGIGYTPSAVPPTLCPPKVHNSMSYGQKPKDPCKPDDPSHPNYPDFFPNGRDWSDKPLYDTEGSEHAMQRHDCGHHDCDIYPENPLGWGQNN